MKDPSAPVKTVALGKGLIHMILSYCSLPARVPLQKLGLYAGAYTYDPALPARVPVQKLGLQAGGLHIRSYPILLYLREYPCKNWGSRQGTRILLSSFAVPAPVPVQNLGLKAGVLCIRSYPILLSLHKYPCKNWGFRQGAYTYDPIPFFFTCGSTPAKTGALCRGLIHTILSYSSLPAGVPLQKLGL